MLLMAHADGRSGHWWAERNGSKGKDEERCCGQQVQTTLLGGFAMKGTKKRTKAGEGGRVRRRLRTVGKYGHTYRSRARTQRRGRIDGAGEE